jgi:hypothetical protein
MCRFTFQDPEYLSELSFSLALSDLSLATLKLQANLGLDESDVDSAARLKRHLEVCLENMTIPETIPLEAVPDPGLRSILKETFASMGPVCTTYDLDDVPVLTQIVNLLEAMVTSGALDANDASRLDEMITCLEHTEEEPPYQPDLELSGS